MHAACLACGHEPWAGEVRAYQEARGGKDVAALRKEARQRGGAMGELLDLVADRLEGEDGAVDGFEATLLEAFGKATETLERAAGRPTDARTRAILGATVDELADFLEAAGLIKGRERLRADLQAIIDTARQSAKVQGLPAGIVQMERPALRALLDPRDGAFWRDKIAKPAAGIIRDGFNRATTLQPLSQTVADISRKLDKSVAQAKSIARTEIALFDRLVNAQVAERAELEQWLYLGPIDGLTRPFCRALVGKVIDVEQAQELDNGGFGNVLVAGGGINCRHRTVAVSEGYIARRGLTLATAGDIATANAAGARKAAA